MTKNLKKRGILAVALIFTLIIGMCLSTEPVTAASDPYDVPEYVLRVGASTNDSNKIKTAQKALNAVCNERLSVDGGYGSLMQAAVKRYQSSRRLTSDGKVGRDTWNYLIGEYLAYQQLKTSVDCRIMQCGTTNGCLDIPSEAQYSDGARVQLWAVVNGNKNQLFYLTRNTDGSYRINVRISGKALEVRNSSMSNGGQVAQWKYESGYKCKHWYIVYDRSKMAYEIINQNSGLALDLTGNNLVKSTKYQQYSRNGTLAQRFTFATVSSSDGGNQGTNPSTPTTPSKPTTPTAPSAASGYYKVSHQKGVNLRSNASTSGTVLMAIPCGAVINVSQTSGNWGKTTYGGKSGWVSLDYCTKTTAPSTSTNPSIPSNPSTSTGKYNASAALKFAKAHWDTDRKWKCAEYVARCLKAGGLNIKINNSIRTVGSLYDKVKQTKTGAVQKLVMEKNGQILYSKNKGKLSVGDPIFIYCKRETDGHPFVHVVLTSQLNSSKSIYVYAHNLPKNNESYNFNRCHYCKKAGRKITGGTVAYAYHFN